ncbi:hypothetical protein BURKHO8Y_520122 [Burkholderia sp. 8Y]|nr:hypothetical protein BURKHO8Y_520122 [Burkholderia sp. 8Y]
MCDSAYAGFRHPLLRKGGAKAHRGAVFELPLGAAREGRGTSTAQFRAESKGEPDEQGPS